MSLFPWRRKLMSDPLATVRIGLLGFGLTMLVVAISYIGRENPPIYPAVLAVVGFLGSIATSILARK
jgi:succinate-acetate transporter protein